MDGIGLFGRLLPLGLLWCGWVNAEPSSIRVACYNVETLYDTIPGPMTDDRAFTPCGSKRWGTERYMLKIKNIARVIDDLNADLLALEEVENETVVRDLMYAMQSDYNYIHRDSRDRRGMDVVLFYRGSLFTPLAVRQIGGKGLTRELLSVRGVLVEDTVTLILCHMPSLMNAAAYRKAAFMSLRQVVDSLLREEPTQKLMLLGDFNVEPHAREVTKILHWQTSRGYPCALYAPFAELSRQGYGTLVYRDKRQLFDYMLLSPAFLSSKKWYYRGDCGIFVRDYMIHTSGDLKGYPLRSFHAGHYTAGYSDHLPVFLELEK